MRFRFFVLVCALAMCSDARPRAEADAFEACERGFEAEPGIYSSSFCFYQVAQREKRFDEAAAHLEVLRGRHPDNFWLVLTLGHVERRRHPERVESLYREAAAGFASQGHAEGEVSARTNIRTLLRGEGRQEEALEQIELTVDVAEESEVPELIAQAHSLRGSHIVDTGGDLSEAYRSLRKAEAMIFPEGPYNIQRGVLLNLGNACREMGRFDEALRYYARLEAITREAENPFSEAAATYSIATTRLDQLGLLPEPGGRTEVAKLAHRALETARGADNKFVEIMSLRMLAELADAEGDHDRADELLNECIHVGRPLNRPWELGHCLWTMAVHLAESDVARASSLAQEAIGLALATGDPEALVRAWRHRMYLSWKTESREQAVSDSLATLSAIEALRRLQDDHAGRAQLFSVWSEDYYRLSGWLLSSERPSREDVTLAFSVTERLRARVLLDALTSEESIEVANENPLVVERKAVLEELVAVQRELLDPSLPHRQRRLALQRLESLELSEADLQARLRARSVDFERREPAFASLEDVESSLGEHEALLSYQVGLGEDIFGEFGGGAWLSSVTRSGTRFYPIPDRKRLQAIVPMFVGLFESRDGSEARPSEKLYRELLDDAVSELPDSITSLIIIPDGMLNHLPFGALRKTQTEDPLALRFDVTYAPSATLWHHWRRAVTPPSSRRVLALADPSMLGARGGAAAETRNIVLAQGARLGALPFAREEGRQIVQRLGQSSSLRVGKAASEQFVKSVDLSPYAVVHFAAHAVTDELYPERSAVVLAAGAASEDGLLQAREIRELDLSGRVVVLSACNTTNGTVLRGEGVLSLARSFFQAGAHAVIGTRWPLRDDDAAWLFDRFYQELARGTSLERALSEAKRQAYRQDLPAAAWAGVDLLGVGNTVPLPGGVEPSRAPWPRGIALVVVLAVVALAVVAFALKRRRARPA